MKGWTISLPPLMSEPRSCARASLGGGRGWWERDALLRILELGVADPVCLNLRSQLRLFPSLQGQPWKERGELGGRQRKQVVIAAFEHYQRSIRGTPGIVHGRKDCHSVCSHRWAPSPCSGTCRHYYASCFHVFKTQPCLNGSKRARACARAHTHIKNFQYFLPPMGVYADPQKKKIFVCIIHIFENLS